MINVSWYDALAYCRWLSAKLGLDIRLPAEWEWQWAAAGNTQQDYPWTGAWNPVRANSREAGIGRTVAVGLYPLGRSPFGVDDMAGNVLEWCLNLHDQSNDIVLSTSEARVVRGGSWLFIPDYARSSARYYAPPVIRFDHLGFRVLCSSPIEKRIADAAER